MVSTTHKNGDFGDGLWNCFNHINYFYVPISIATRSKLPEGSRCGKANDMERSSYGSKDGTPVAVPTGAINFGEPGTNGQGDPDDERNSLLLGFKHEWIIVHFIYGIYGMSSFPLTNSMIFQRGWLKPPTSLWIPWWIWLDFTIQGGKWRFLTTNI